MSFITGPKTLDLPPPPEFTLTHFFQQSGSLKALLIKQLQHLNCYQVNIKKIAHGIVNSIMSRQGQRKIKSHYQRQRVFLREICNIPNHTYQ